MGVQKLLSLTIADSLSGWRRSGFHISPADAHSDGSSYVRIGTVDLRFRDTVVGDREESDGGKGGFKGAGILEWNFLDESVDSPLELSLDGLDHVVVYANDVRRTVASIEAKLAIKPRRLGPVKGRDGRIFGFFRLSNVIIEVTGPSIPSPEDTALPAAMGGLAFTVPDIHASHRAVELAKDVHPAMQPGRLIFSLDQKKAGVRVPLAWMSEHVKVTYDKVTGEILDKDKDVYAKEKAEMLERERKARGGKHNL
ncbi:hypothetical protein HDU93_009194 [Gonapodya sp. JEL0774]|nr:hypothetical protein HDU93_009194 [Gonapodya sp. JEL0774]